MRIQSKIILPFSCVFVVVLAGTAIITARIAVRLQERMVQSQAMDMARFINEARLPLSPLMLQHLERVTGKKVAFYDSAKSGFTSMIDGFAPPNSDTTQVMLDDVSWRMFQVPIGGDGSKLYLLMKESELTRESRAATRPFFILAGVGAIVTIVIGWMITKSITQPIRALASTAEEIAPSNEAQGGDAQRSADEVAYLADAFERMLVRLKQSQAKLVESEKLSAVGRVATGIAHEIRNPLAAMKMNAQILQEQIPDDDTPGVIIREIERLQLLIDELLSHGVTMKLNVRPAVLSDVLDECIASLAARLRHAHVKVVYDYAAQMPPVTMDEQRIKQVVINLVLNAMEAMPGGGTLTVRTLSSANEAVVEFEDTGCGIVPEIAPRVLDAFFSTREGGIGLGLAVSRRIVEEHGGRISFENRSPGTLFRVNLPMKGRSDG